MQQISDECNVRDDNYTTRNPLLPKKVVGDTSCLSTSKLSVGGSSEISTNLLTHEIPRLIDNNCPQISHQEQCNNNPRENLGIVEVLDECAHDYKGDLIGGATNPFLS